MPSLISRTQHNDFRHTSLDIMKDQVYRLNSPTETVRLGHIIGSSLQGGETLCLVGTLGAGKTLFTRGVASGNGSDPEAISSPTFALIHEYDGKFRIIHVDFYRIEHPSEVSGLGLEEYVTDHTVMLIEWADRALHQLPTDHLLIELTHAGRHSRMVSLHPRGITSTTLFDTIMKQFPHS